MKVVARFVVILMTCINPLLISAQGAGNDPLERKAVVTYAGSKDDNSIVLLDVKNEKAEKFVVLVLQKNGSVLYRENFSDKKVTKRFFIPRDIVSEVKIVITDEKERSREEYQLNTRFVEEVYVSKNN